MTMPLLGEPSTRGVTPRPPGGFTGGLLPPSAGSPALAATQRCMSTPYSVTPMAMAHNAQEASQRLVPPHCHSRPSAHCPIAHLRIA